MYAVPNGLREASFGLGARRKATSLRIVVPAAISGIVAAIIVGFSRALGETMVVAIAAGGSGGASFTLSPLQPGQTATGAMAALATGTDQVEGARSGVQLPLLRRAAALRAHVHAEPGQRALRAPVSDAVLMALATDLTTSRVEETLQGDHRDIGGSIFAGILLFALIASLAVLLLLFWSVAQRGVPLLAERGLSFLTDGPSAAPSRAGIGPALFGSVVMMGIVAIVAFPLGVAAAVYLEEYARDTKLTRLLTANIRNLAGVPSIVYGILGLVVFVVALQKAIAINPVRVVDLGGPHARGAYPAHRDHHHVGGASGRATSSIREAAYGVGATRWEVIRSHVLPYALPGILTGVIVSLARAFGETAPLLLVGAVRGFFTTTGGLFDQDPPGPLHGVCPSRSSRGRGGSAARVPGSRGCGHPCHDGGPDPDERHRDLAEEPV